MDSQERFCGKRTHLLLFGLYLLQSNLRALVNCVEVSVEKKLIRDLLVIYEEVTPHGRPVVHDNTTVNVQFGLGLIQMELDEKEKALSLSLWAKYVWTDEYLKWNPLMYSNITTVKLATRLIWLPDIMLYNTAETDSSLRDTLTTIHYNGTVLWVPHQKLKSSCSIDVTNFPFDRQKCHMWFGSWTYTKEDLNLSLAFNDGSCALGMRISELWENTKKRILITYP